MKTATDTITTLPAVIYPNASTVTVGLKGNTVQNGTPTPDSPIMPDGTGDRTGNLFDIDARDTNNGYVNNMQLNQDGTMTSYTPSEITEYIELTPNATYTLSNIGSYNSLAYCIYDNDRQYITGDMYRGQTTKVINMPPNGKYLRFTHVKAKPNTMLNTGSTALPYEPYGIKIPISCGGTTTPVYLGEVQSTRRVNKLVLTGEENWDLVSSNAPYRLLLPNLMTTTDRTAVFFICSHFRAVSNDISWSQYDSCMSVSFSGGINVKSLQFRYTSVSSLDDFKSYLAAQYAAGTPVTVWYVLATPETAVVNEPLMKIGDYADEVSNISIPVTAGENTLDVQTTVAPSEVTAGFSGWHPVQSVHEKSANLMDRRQETVGYFVNADGEEVENSGWSVSDYIAMDAESSYTVSNVGLAGDAPKHCFYDINKNFISSMVSGSGSFTTPQNTAYGRFSYVNFASNIMLNEGDTALPYEPYWD